MSKKHDPKHNYDAQNITTESTKFPDKKILKFSTPHNHGNDYISGTTPTKKFGIPQRTIDILKSRNNSHHQRIYKYFPNIDKSMLPETGSQSHIIRAGLTNDLIKERNYTAFMDQKNASTIMKKLASTVLVKLSDIDKGAIGHIFNYIKNNKDWAEKNPDIVLDEMRNAIKQLENKKAPTLKILLDLIKETEDILEQHKTFQRHRTGNLKHNIETLVEEAKEKTLSVSKENLDIADINREYLLSQILKVQDLELPTIQKEDPANEERLRQYPTLYNDFIYSQENSKNLHLFIKDNIDDDLDKIFFNAEYDGTYSDFIIKNKESQEIKEYLEQILPSMQLDTKTYNEYISNISQENLEKYDQRTRDFIKRNSSTSKEDMTLLEVVKEHYRRDNGPDNSVKVLKRMLDKLDDMNMDASTQEFGSLGRMRMKDLSIGISSYKSLANDFPDSHNSSMDIASEVARNIIRKTNEPPVATLAVLALNEKELEERYGNDGISLKKESEAIIIKEIQRAASQNKHHIENEVSESILKKMKEILRDNKKDLFGIFSPHQDTIDTQRSYDPRNFTMSDKNNDIALNAVRDSLYLATLSELDKENYTKVFKSEEESQLIKSGIDKSILDLRPDSERVNDIQNIMLLMDKIDSTEIDKDTAKKIMNSSIFTENKMINQEDGNAFGELIEELSEKHEYDNQDAIFGIPDDEDTERHIQYRNYTEASKIFTDKVSDLSIKSLFQNNQILVDFSDCMETSKSPTNNTETSPSLAKDCFKKLEDAARQAYDATGQLLTSQGAGFTPFTAFLVLARIQAATQEMEVSIVKANLQHRIRQTTGYVLNTETQSQSNARIMLSEIKDKNYGGNYVKDGFEERLINISEEEGTVAEILNISRGNLDKNLKLDASIEGYKKLQALMENSSTLKDSDEKIDTTKEKIKALKLDIQNAKNTLSKLLSQYGSAISEDSIDEEQSQERISTLKKNMEGFEGDLKSAEKLLKDLEKTKRNDDKNISIDKNLLKRVSKKEFDLSDMDLNEMERISIVLGKYRDSLYKEAVNTKDDAVDRKRVKSLMKEASRIERIIPQIHKQILNSNELFADVITHELSNEYSIDLVSDDEFQKEIRENGLSEGVISKILQKFKQDTSDEKDAREVLTKLTELQTIKRLTDTEHIKHINAEDANILHSYITRIKNTKNSIVDTLNKTNNHNFTKGSTSNGKTYIMGAYGKDGYILAQAGELIDKGNLVEAEKYLKHTNNKHLSRELTTYISNKQDTVKSANKDASFTKELKSNDETRNYQQQHTAYTI